MIVVISTGESTADARQVLAGMAAGAVELVGGNCVSGPPYKHGDCAHVGVQIAGTIDPDNWTAPVQRLVQRLELAPPAAADLGSSGEVKLGDDCRGSYAEEAASGTCAYCETEVFASAAGYWTANGLDPAGDRSNSECEQSPDGRHALDRIGGQDRPAPEGAGDTQAPERAGLLAELLAEHRGYLEATRRTGPGYAGKAGRARHARHQAKMRLLVELLEAAV